MQPTTIFLLVIAAVITLRLFADRLDRERIRQDATTRGDNVLDIRWRPFGPGWFGEKSDRIYEVTWQDIAGTRHVAYCKTSLFTGVYWTGDGTGPGWSASARGRPGQRSPANEASPVSERGQREDPGMSALRDENRRLREENERLRRART